MTRVKTRPTALAELSLFGLSIKVMTVKDMPSNCFGLMSENDYAVYNMDNGQIATWRGQSIAAEEVE